MADTADQRPDVQQHGNEFNSAYASVPGLIRSGRMAEQDLAALVRANIQAVLAAVLESEQQQLEHTTEQLAGVELPQSVLQHDWARTYACAH